MSPTLRGRRIVVVDDEGDKGRARTRATSRAPVSKRVESATSSRSPHRPDATRRSAPASATEGGELVDAVNANVYVVPKDHAWVTADADAMGEDGGRVRHEDSRTFGPVEARALESRASCTRSDRDRSRRGGEQSRGARRGRARDRGRVGEREESARVVVELVVYTIFCVWTGFVYYGERARASSRRRS